MKCECPDDRHPSGCSNQATQQIAELMVCDSCRACYESDPDYFPGTVANDVADEMRAKLRGRADNFLRTGLEDWPQKGK